MIWHILIIFEQEMTNNLFVVIKWDFSFTLLSYLHSSVMYLFKEIAGKSENVEEGGISERRCDLPMLGQGMRRVRLSGGKPPELKSITTQTEKGDWGGSWGHGSNPPDWSHWSAGTRWWPRWCSARRYPVNEITTSTARCHNRGYTKRKRRCCGRVQARTHL